MASNTATNPDTLITVKVIIHDTTRRFKLPLRDLGANVFPDKLRFLLALHPAQQVIFERFSDSAGTFVTLDPDNLSVWKQQYRAAKAKLKLRIRAKIIEEPSTAADESASTEEPKAAPTEPPMPQMSSAQLAEALFTPRHHAAFSTVVAASKATKPSPMAYTSLDIPTSTAEEEKPTPAPVEQIQATKSTEAPTPRVFRYCGRTPAAQYAAMRCLATQGASAFTVFCNACNSPIPDSHYHCSICDNGDYDLCKRCVDSGKLCDGTNHWLIKRTVQNGRVVMSTTETIAPKKASLIPSQMASTPIADKVEPIPQPSRTCNDCMESLREAEFVTCLECDDFDLCLDCHVRQGHGHHPGHAFKPVCDDANLEDHLLALCAPGRNKSHAAICDGCDKSIRGIRYKCLDCPDWDYCSNCIESGEIIHPGHRIVPLFDTIKPLSCLSTRHIGIYCDGPLCKTDNAQTYIRGDRYKCAVCHDTDFCSRCEAHPLNPHNKTHPLIKFKTPVRGVTVCTEGQKGNGEAMRPMGDNHARTRSTGTDPGSPASSTNVAVEVQTVADLKPTIEDVDESTEVKREVISPTNELQACFVKDSVPDGTELPPNCIFRQTWTVRNPGHLSWPAGCSVKFTGGDNLFNLDAHRPSSMVEFEKARETNTTASEVLPGGEYSFDVTLRTPKRFGRMVSYWRLTGPDGQKFGHKLWVEINVLAPETVAPKVESVESEASTEGLMIFPKLEKESPTASSHEAQEPAPTVEDDNESLVDRFHNLSAEDDQRTLHTEEDGEDWSIDGDDSSVDGFLTDEEYDILDASDEEFLTEASKAAKK